MTSSEAPGKDRPVDVQRIPERTERLAHLGHWMWHLKDDRFEWSAGMYAIYGIDRGVDYEQRIALATRALHPDDRERLRTWHLQQLAGGQSKPLEYRIVRPDGAVRLLWLETEEPTCDAEGRPLSLLGVIQDVTERRRFEASSRENEDLLRRLVEAMPGILYTFERSRGGAYYSPQVERILGWSPQHLHDHPMLWHDSIHPEDVPRVDAAIASEASTIEIEYRIRDAFGRWHWMFDRSVRIVQSGGDKTIDGLALDVTDRKQGELERDRLEAQLRQAHKMESVGRLAGGVAHDFNNMLGVILGSVELALDQVAPESSVQAELLEIRKATERSSDLTRQLLTFARKQFIAPEVLDLDAAVSSTTKMLARLIGENIRLEWRPFGRGLWPVKIDPSQLNQVLANLCVNARDAVGESGTVTIETANETLDATFGSTHDGLVEGDFVRLTVRDDGRGMDEDTIAHIFEPFFTTKPVGEGTGLGLATVYGIVKQNGGHVAVTSKKGAGATFSVYLPKHHRPMPSRRPERPTPLGARRGETILLVEDEPGILRATTRLLERLGYRVLAANDAREAIELARAHGETLDLLLTDVVMPDMNGRELAEVLRSTHPRLPCLFMSGYTADVIERRTGAEASDTRLALLSKPFSMQELAAHVRQMLEPDRED